MEDHRAEPNAEQLSEACVPLYGNSWSSTPRSQDARGHSPRELQIENARLKEELARLKGALDHERALHLQSPFAHLCLDRLGRVIQLSARAAQLLGDDASRIIGKPLLRFVERESRNQLLMHLHSCRSGYGAAGSDLKLKSGRRDKPVHVELVSAVGPKGDADTLCYMMMLETPEVPRLPLPDVALDPHWGLSRAVRFLQTQRMQLEEQNQRLRDTQQLLQDSRDRYAHLYEFSPVGYVTLDVHGNVQVCNLTAALMLGADRSRITGHSFMQYVEQRDTASFERHIEQCRAGAPIVKSEFRLRTAQGTREMELISLRPPEEGEPRLYRTALMDITERKLATDALRASEAKLRWLIDNMPAVLWIRDQSGGPRYVSANIRHVIGYAEHEVRSGGARFWSDNIHPEDRERVEAAYASMFADPESAPAKSYDIEYRRQASDGSWVWVVDRGMSVSEDHGERYATGMFWDTTRRKRMQEQLRESEERFRQLAEHINEVFFLTDVDGRHVFYVSPAFEKVWGYSADSLYRDPASWLDIVHEKDRKRLRRAVRTRRSHAAFDHEFRIRRPSGALRWIRMRGFPIYDTNGHIHRLAGIAVDVTARKEAGEALQRSHQKMRELAIHLQSVREEERKRIAREIHDELGALLLAIKMDAEACRKRSPGRTAGDRARTLTQLVSRVDAALASVRRIATDLRPSILDNVGVLAAVEWQAQDMQRRTGIVCEVHKETDREELDVDPDRATAIFRIVQEALSNVVRHSNAKHVKIALRERNGHVELTIADDGTGIGRETPPDRGRWGLVGMSERVSAFQGKFDIRAAEPHGTVIAATIPARPDANAS